MNTLTTVASAFVYNMLEGARAKGFDVSRVLLDSGISPQALGQERSRVTFDQLARLKLSLIKLLGDEYIGLLETPQPSGAFKLCCYCAINAETIGESLRLFAQFANLQKSGLVHEVSVGGGASRYGVRRRPAALVRNNYVIEYILLTVHRMHCWMANKRLALVGVNLDFARPEYASEYRYVFYGAPVKFDASDSSIMFRDDDLALPNTRTIDELKAFLLSTPITLLHETIDSHDMSARVRRRLQQELVTNYRLPDFNSSAAYFRLHPQTLRRRLKRDGTSFKQIKLEVRRDLAINLINSGEHSVEEIADRLDYSEPAAFIRAFKNWLGMTPLAYRKLHE
ncbi:MAG: AraC family transcriptional regulator [Gammaproteobacteria bacterium]|nr:AraC family transcriptional regulator [Gammaproteobacteria bacterium]